MPNPLLKNSNLSETGESMPVPSVATSATSSSAPTKAANNGSGHLIADPDGHKREKMEGAIQSLLETGIKREKVTMTEFLAPYRSELKRLHKAGKGATLAAIATKLTEMTGMRVTSKVVGDVIRGHAGSQRRPVTKAATDGPKTRD